MPLQVERRPVEAEHGQRALQGAQPVRGDRLAVAALLSVQMRRMRWVAMAVAIALTGLVIQDLLDTYDTMQKMNLAPNASISIVRRF